MNISVLNYVLYLYYKGSWLRPHIRVRIVDKDFKGGKFYLKKARVLDVTGRGVCVVQVNPPPWPKKKNTHTSSFSLSLSLPSAAGNDIPGGQCSHGLGA